MEKEKNAITWVGIDVMFPLNLTPISNTFFYDDVIPSQVLWDELQFGVEEATHAHKKETASQNLWEKTQ